MIIKNVCSFPRQHVETCGITISTIWDVSADESYDISVEQSRHDSLIHSGISGDGMIIVRTFSGKGRIHLSPEKHIDVFKGSLLLTDYKSIRRYHTLESEWRFWWIEIYSKYSLYIPQNRALTCPVMKNEFSAFADITTGLRMEGMENIHLATARLISLIYLWWAGCEHDEAAGRNDDTISKTIDMMYEKISKNMTVAQMASYAGMSITGFRKAFKKATGTAPKTFYDTLRLNMARQLLRQGRHNITEIAGQLGYCDAFHFSKVFRTHFGSPPSRM